MAGLTIEQFWDITPRELMIVFDAHQTAIGQTRDLLAWHACCIMNVWLAKKDRVTPDQLTGKRKSIPLSFFGSKEKMKEFLNKKLEERKDNA